VFTHHDGEPIDYSGVFDRLTETFSYAMGPAPIHTQVMELLPEK